MLRRRLYTGSVLGAGVSQFLQHCSMNGQLNIESKLQDRWDRQQQHSAGCYQAISQASLVYQLSVHFKNAVFWDVAFAFCYKLSCTMRMETPDSTETFLNFYQTTECHIPEVRFFIAVSEYFFDEVCRDPRRHVAWVTKFFTVAPNICGTCFGSHSCRLEFWGGP
jgi:hypothetical protein